MSDVEMGLNGTSKKKQKNDVRGQNPKNLAKMYSKGLPVIEGDAEKELINFLKNRLIMLFKSNTASFLI